MGDFYTEMGQMARSLLAPTSQNGLGQGKIELTHIEPGAVDPLKPWEPVEPTTTTAELRGAVRGVDRKLVGVEIGGIVILASDRVAITEVPPIPYTAGDTLSIDGVPVHIIQVEGIPAAGIRSAVRFLIRG
ncbi:hypothetical protein [Pseudomonas sp.]|uniref:hypothetical protein n=1 Tax=Pseudomonas sp. TaxID=306 RepID=UPI0025839A79|nr:hypothetical protein [Pseudomonas sp.]